MERATTHRHFQRRRAGIHGRTGTISVEATEALSISGRARLDIGNHASVADPSSVERGQSP
jgi:hypothetical protein